MSNYSSVSYIGLYKIKEAQESGEPSLTLKEPEAPILPIKKTKIIMKVLENQQVNEFSTMKI